MTSAISREEADKISGDFEKIASRGEKSKTVQSNIKIVLIVVTVMVVMLIILIYFYLKNPKNVITGKGSKLMKAPAESTLHLEAGNQMPQMPQPLFGGQPLDLTSGSFEN